LFRQAGLVIASTDAARRIHVGRLSTTETDFGEQGVVAEVGAVEDIQRSGIAISVDAGGSGRLTGPRIVRSVVNNNVWFVTVGFIAIVSGKVSDGYTSSDVEASRCDVAKQRNVPNRVYLFSSRTMLSLKISSGRTRLPFEVDLATNPRRGLGFQEHEWDACFEVAAPYERGRMRDTKVRYDDFVHPGGHVWVENACLLEDTIADQSNIHRSVANSVLKCQISRSIQPFVTEEPQRMKLLWTIVKTESAKPELEIGREVEWASSSSAVKDRTGTGSIDASTIIGSGILVGYVDTLNVTFISRGELYLSRSAEDGIVEVPDLKRKVEVVSVVESPEVCHVHIVSDKVSTLWCLYVHALSTERARSLGRINNLHHICETWTLTAARKCSLGDPVSHDAINTEERLPGWFVCRCRAKVLQTWFCKCICGWYEN